MCRFSETNNREQLRRDEEVWRLDQMLHECLYQPNTTDHFEIDTSPRVVPKTDCVGFTLHCWFDVTEPDYVEAMRSLLEQVVRNFERSRWSQPSPRPGQVAGSVE